MEFFRGTTHIPFMKQRKIAAVISAILIIGSLIAIFTQGLNFGLDFTGGTELEVKFQQAAPVNAIRDHLKKAGFAKAEVKTLGDAKDVSVRVAPHKELSQDQLKQKVMSVLPEGVHLSRFDFIGPSVGKALVTNGILAIVISLLAIMIYIAARFEYRFAVSAAIALIHDPLLILGIFAAFHLEFNLIVLTALLTVIGYSINDTVVVYDRVRENFRKVRKKTVLEVMDLSINETLSRTIMTSGLTLLVVLALYFFGGDVLEGFSLAFIIGIVVGTYSSIYVAGALAVAFGLNREKLVPAKKVYDDAP